MLTVAQQVNRIIKACGYDYYFAYNNKQKTQRTLKFMQNGYIHSIAEYEEWDQKIQQELKAQNIQYKSAGWRWCSSWRGDYKAYFVVVPLTK